MPRTGPVQSSILFPKVPTSPVPHGARLLLVSGFVDNKLRSEPQKLEDVLHSRGSPSPWFVIKQNWNSANKMSEASSIWGSVELATKNFG